jgi:hypothetical protein
VTLVGYFASFLLMFIGFYAGRGHPARVFPTLLGSFAALNGVLLASNFHGAANLYGRWALLRRGWRTLGVDYSGLLFARPWFIRVFGLCFGLVGVAFAFAGLSAGS